MAERPVVAVGAVVLDDAGRVLLIRRARPPGAGLWSVPGGKVEAGETLADACRREVREETGVEIELGPVCEILERIVPGFHYVILDFVARPARPSAQGPAPRAAGDVSDARWIAADELDRYATTDGLAPVVARARALAAQPVTGPCHVIDRGGG